MAVTGYGQIRRETPTPCLILGWRETPHRFEVTERAPPCESSTEEGNTLLRRYRARGPEAVRDDGRLQVRADVVHDVGMFQGRLEFDRVIVLLEDGCDEFSSI